MASSIYNRNEINTDIEFITNHIGGNNDEDDKILNNQLKLINTQNKSNLNNKEEKQNLKNIIGQNNIANPLVIPEEFDEYIEYIKKKNLNPLNTRVLQNFNYINVDTSNRLNNINTNYILLDNNPLEANNNSNILKIYTKNLNFEIGDKINIQGINITSIKKEIKFIFTNNSNRILIDLEYDFNYINKFYNILIEFKDVKNTDNYFGNIELNSLNQIQTIYLYDNKLAFDIPQYYYGVNSYLISNTKITYNNISNIPINIINAYLPLGKINLNEYQIITNKTNDYIEIQLPISFSLKSNIIKFGGNNIQIGKIELLTNNTNYEYTFEFNQKFENIVSIKILSSEIQIPFQNKNNIVINESNNYFYWENNTDNIEYNIKIPSGIYNYNKLAITIQLLINSTKRITNIPNLKLLNDCICNFDANENNFSFTSYNNFILPKCLYNLTNINDTYIITILQPKHTLKNGDKITILNSIGYYYINEIDINTTHIISNAIENYYDIILININLYNDIGNTYGGNKIIIKTNNYFKILFDKENTIGNVLHFSNVGSSEAVTIFSNNLNNNTNYLYTAQKNENVNLQNPNFTYLLLKCEKLNKCINPYNVNYFYKFLMNYTNINENNILYNSFVDTPLYFNPPIPHIENLKLTMTNSINENINCIYSLTLEIITITNSLENTTLSTTLGKI